MNLDKFATDRRTYRSTTDSSGAVSDVVRLPADSSSPLRYRKVVKGRQSSLVANEQKTLNYCAVENLNKTVRMLDYQIHLDPNSQDKHSQEITTKSAGVDLDHGGWLGTPIYLTQYHYQAPDIFFNPLLSLTTFKYSLEALYQIHRHGIIHCDIKLDNICLPFEGDNAEKGETIVPIFEQITLIDFGQSHWVGNTLGSSSRNWLGICKEDYRYQSKYLISVLKQWSKDNKNNKRQFDNRSLEQINYSCDLYSLGFAFNLLISRMDGYSDLLNIPPWSLIWSEYQQLIDQLLSYDNGLPNSESADLTNLPHPTFISQIDDMIAKLESHLGYGANGIKLQLRQSAYSDTPIAESNFTPTPIAIFEEDSVTSDEEAWAIARQADSIEGYQAYIKAYPNGKFNRQAIDKINCLLPKSQSENYLTHKPPQASEPINISKTENKIKPMRFRNLTLLILVALTVVISSYMFNNKMNNNMLQVSESSKPKDIFEINKSLLNEPGIPNANSLDKTQFEEIERLAKEGDDDAMRKLGLFYYHGVMVAQDYNKAWEFFEKSDTPEGLRYNAISSLKVDPDTGVFIDRIIFDFQDSASRGDRYSQAWLDKLYTEDYKKYTYDPSAWATFSEQSFPYLYRKGFRYLFRGESEKAFNTFANMPDYELVTFKNIESSEADEHKEENEYSKSQNNYLLSCMYEHGIGVEVDQVKAEELLSNSLSEDYNPYYISLCQSMVAYNSSNFDFSDLSIEDVPSNIKDEIGALTQSDDLAEAFNNRNNDNLNYMYGR